jgi:hypothetical protein
LTCLWVHNSTRSDGVCTFFRRAGFYPKWKTLTFWPGIKRLHQCQNGERRVLWSSQVHGSKGLCVIFCVSTYRMQKERQTRREELVLIFDQKVKKAFILELSRSNRSLANCFVYSILLIISAPQESLFHPPGNNNKKNMQSPFFLLKIALFSLERTSRRELCGDDALLPIPLLKQFHTVWSKRE